MAKKNKKILIVEDDKLLLEVLKKRFIEEKFRVLEAINGEDGLKKAIDNRPDIILLDIIMPVMDGMTMLEKLREDEWGKNVEVIILTNLSDVSRVQESLSKGVYDYLVKSDWRLDDLIKRVKNKVK